jgi:diadenylate cyclase
MEQIIAAVQSVFANFNMISIFDIIDIAIMAFLIYKFIMILRTTSSGGVVKGIILVVLALGASNVLHLYTFNFLLSKMLEMGVLALVVLFQPELRKILAQVGNSSFGTVFSDRPGSTDELEKAITQTVEAYTALSKSKTGALMVFERKNMLDDAIRTGTSLDTVVNSELLKNIFWNKAPLHDGAVIVRNGRIVGAGCMLPMSGNVNLSRDLGMRHRAGIGVSEQSDAVVAIVSEETGSISVAVGGMLKRHLAPETLERLLRNELLPEKKEEDTPLSKLSALFRGKKEAKRDGANDQV